MHKILIFLLFVPILGFSDLNIIKVQNILSQLRSNKELKFYNANKQIALKGKLRFTSKESADIILFTTEDNEKLSIATSYKALKANKNSIGAIYIKKGRTQIIFIEERLKKHNLWLLKEYRQYLLKEYQLNPLALLIKLK